MHIESDDLNLVRCGMPAEDVSYSYVSGHLDYVFVWYNINIYNIYNTIQVYNRVKYCYTL